MKIAGQIKGLDTSKVEVDDEQAPPTVEAGSAEEQALYQEMEGHMKSAGLAPESFDKDIKMMCLRERLALARMHGWHRR
jgi:hypothetical protein